MQVGGCVINGSQDRRPVYGDPGQFPVVIEHPHNVVLAAASHHRQDFAGQAARRNEDQLTHRTAALPVVWIVLMTRLMLTVSSSW